MITFGSEYSTFLEREERSILSEGSQNGADNLESLYKCDLCEKGRAVEDTVDCISLQALCQAHCERSFPQQAESACAVYPLLVEPPSGNPARSFTPPFSFLPEAKKMRKQFVLV